jgi:glycerol-3-phosphate dehydrogenase
MDSSKYIFSGDRRSLLVTELESRKFDLVVIGGGITGAGIALDAASRGLSVALVEKNDFASGTSSRSTKLIHGGLRYLKNFEFKLVKTVGKERAIVYRNAPHLVVPEKMLLPIIEKGSFGKFGLKFGLWLYDRLAKVNSSEKRIMLNSNETKAKEPLINKEGLKGSGYYSEYRTDDARLTVEVMKTAASKGALCLNYASCEELDIENDQITCKDIFTGESFLVNTKLVVNAAGPWVDRIREKEGSFSGKRLHHTKGVHLVVPKRKLPVENSVYFDVGDGRMIFAIPRFHSTYIGTTDTNYVSNGEEKSLSEPGVTQADVKYLLDACNRMFPNVNLQQADISSSWSGLRPLIHEDGKSPSELSRKDEIFVSDSGLISIAGGKLTGYRLMAKNVVDLVCQNLNIQQECRTESIAIVGGDFEHLDKLDQYIRSLRARMNGYGLDGDETDNLVRTFGKQCDIIIDKSRKFESNRLIQAVAWFCLRNEQVNTLADFYVRRTGYLYFYPERISQTLDLVLPLFAEFLNWNNERVEQEKKEIHQLLKSITDFGSEEA